MAPEKDYIRITAYVRGDMAVLSVTTVKKILEALGFRVNRVRATVLTHKQFMRGLDSGRKDYSALPASTYGP